jgi:hypothetical protein
VDAPVVAVVHVSHRRRHAALGHHRVRLAEQRLQTRPTRAPFAEASMAAETGAAGTDRQHVVFDCLDFAHRAAPRSIEARIR